MTNWRRYKNNCFCYCCHRKIGIWESELWQFERGAFKKLKILIGIYIYIHGTQIDTAMYVCNVMIKSEYLICPSTQTCIVSLGGEYLKPDLLAILKYTIIFSLSLLTWLFCRIVAIILPSQLFCMHTNQSPQSLFLCSSQPVLTTIPLSFSRKTSLLVSLWKALQYLSLRSWLIITKYFLAPSMLWKW